MESVADRKRHQSLYWQVPATVVAMAVFGAFIVTAVLALTGAGL